MSDPSTPHTIQIADSGEAYDCRESETVLVGMARLGRRGIPLGCRSGGCGVCKVEVLSGAYGSRIMSRAHVSAEDEAAQRVLACCIYPRTDLVVRPIGQLQRVLLSPCDPVRAGHGQTTPR